MSTTGLQLRDQGIEDVLAASAAVHRGYADLVTEAIEAVGSDGSTWTAEDLHDWIEQTYPDARPHSPNVLPAVIGSLRSARRITAVGHVQCRRPSRRYGWMRAWRLT